MPRAIDAIIKWKLTVFISVDLMQTGKIVTIRNAKIEMYRGCMRLIVDKWGLVEDNSEIEDIMPKVRVTFIDFNASLILTHDCLPL